MYTVDTMQTRSRVGCGAMPQGAVGCLLRFEVRKRLPVIAIIDVVHVVHVVHVFVIGLNFAVAIVIVLRQTG